jgi:membrane associated rhomboid family serine protease
MIFPIGDFPNVRGHVPLVTYLLIAANVAVYFFVSLPLLGERAQNGPLLGEYVRALGEQLSLTRPEELRELVRGLTAYDLFVFAHGFRPAAPTLAALFESIFLHASLLHLAGNMLFLWIYGDNVEHRLGSLRFLLAYLGTGIAATLFHAVSVPGSQIPMIGASGAISGVLGFYFVLFPRNQVRLLFLIPPFFMQVLAVPARLVLGIYLVIENVVPYLTTRGDVGVAHGAHIGGFIAGLAVAFFMRRRDVSHRPREFAAVDARAAGGVGAALAAGRMGEAARAYFALPAAQTRGVLDAAEAVDLARWLRAEGHADAALVVLRRLLQERAADPASAPAHLLAARILLDDQDQAASAYPYFLDAAALAEDPKVEAAARAGIAEIAARQKRPLATARAR